MPLGEPGPEVVSHTFRGIRLEIARDHGLSAKQIDHLAAHQTATHFFGYGFALLAPERVLELAREARP